MSKLWEQSEKALQSVLSCSVLRSDLNIPKVQVIDSSLYSEVLSDGK